MATNTGLHIVNAESNTMDVSNTDGNGATQTFTEPKKYCGIFSKTGLIFTVVIIIAVIAVAVTVPTVLYYKNRWKKFEDSANDSIIVIEIIDPTMSPTSMSLSPTITPTESPTTLPPTMKPTQMPTETGETLSPSVATVSPTKLTISPTMGPTKSSISPSISPSITPTISTPSPTKSPQVSIRVNWNTNQVGGGFSANGFVVGGIDFVQYSLNGVSKPALGAKDGNGNFIYTTIHLGGQFAFVSQENLDTFESEPDRYAPRYGGYCMYYICYLLYIYNYI